MIRTNLHRYLLCIIGLLLQVFSALYMIIVITMFFAEFFAGFFVSEPEITNEKQLMLIQSMDDLFTVMTIWTFLIAMWFFIFGAYICTPNNLLISFVTGGKMPLINSGQDDESGDKLASQPDYSRYAPKK